MYQQLSFFSLEDAGVCDGAEFHFENIPIKSTEKTNALGNRDSKRFPAMLIQHVNVQI